MLSTYLHKTSLKEQIKDIDPTESGKTAFKLYSTICLLVAIVSMADTLTSSTTDFSVMLLVALTTIGTIAQYFKLLGVITFSYMFLYLPSFASSAMELGTRKTLLFTFSIDTISTHSPLVTAAVTNNLMAAIPVVGALIVFCVMCVIKIVAAIID